MFDENELSILSRGPNFIVRESLSKEEFNIEVEKMIVKKNNDLAFSEPSEQDPSTTSPARHTNKWSPASH